MRINKISAKMTEGWLWCAFRVADHEIHVFRADFVQIQLILPVARLWFRKIEQPHLDEQHESQLVRHFAQRLIGRPFVRREQRARLVGVAQLARRQPGSESAPRKAEQNERNCPARDAQNDGFLVHQKPNAS